MIEFAGKTIIEDISDRLPRHPNKVWYPRTAPIRSATFHHTGGNIISKGRIAAVENSAFCSRSDDPQLDGLDGRGWPSTPYHLFVPYEPEIRDGKLVIYRCVPDELNTYHSGLFNNESVGVAFQGTFKSRYSNLGIEPSGWQLSVWPELYAYLTERYSLDAFEFWGHCWQSKPSCPGDTITSLILSERHKDPSRITDLHTLQRALERALDLRIAALDDTGMRMRRAIETFQRGQFIRDINGRPRRALKGDGVFGPATESILRRVLREKGALK